MPLHRFKDLPTTTKGVVIAVSTLVLAGLFVGLPIGLTLGLQHNPEDQGTFTNQNKTLEASEEVHQSLINSVVANSHDSNVYVTPGNNSKIDIFNNTIQVYDNEISTNVNTTISESHNTNDKDNNAGVCFSDTCLKAAVAISQSMGTNEDPCHDFSQYSCRGFYLSTEVSDKDPKIDPFTRVAKTVLTTGRQILEQPESRDDWDCDIKAKRLYKSCMDDKNLRKRGFQPIRDDLKELNGGWSVLGNNHSVNSENTSWKDYRWHEVIPKLAKAGFNTNRMLMSVGTDVDWGNTSRQAVTLGPPLTDYVMKRGMNDLEFMVARSELVGADRARAQRDMQEVLDLQEEIFSAFLSRVQPNVGPLAQYNPYTPGSDILTNYLSSVLFNATLGENDVIVMQYPEFVADLLSILNRTSPRILANFVGWTMVEEFTNNVVVGEKWKRCVMEVGFGNEDTPINVNLRMEVAAASMYVRHLQLDRTKPTVVNMTGYIKEAYLDLIQRRTGIDDSSKEQHINKIKSMNIFISHPDELLNRTIVDSFYSDLSITDSDFFGNVKRLQAFSLKHQSEKLRSSPGTMDWTRHAAKVTVPNAFYEPPLNSINVRGSILQDVFFNKDLPMYLNFGAIGTIFAHEITHAFDNVGMEFDERGQLLSSSEQRATPLLEDQFQCLTDQYSGYYDNQVGKNVDGVRTLRENIADNGALLPAFTAYKKWVSDHGSEPVLPHVGLTAEQLFFVSYAQWHCSMSTDTLASALADISPYANDEARIWGPLDNSEDFSMTFKCSGTSPMNPTNKCSMWPSVRP